MCALGTCHGLGSEADARAGSHAEGAVVRRADGCRAAGREGVDAAPVPVQGVSARPPLVRILAGGAAERPGLDGSIGGAAEERVGVEEEQGRHGARVLVGCRGHGARLKVPQADLALLVTSDEVMMPAFCPGAQRPDGTALKDVVALDAEDAVVVGGESGLVDKADAGVGKSATNIAVAVSKGTDVAI